MTFELDDTDPDREADMIAFYKAETAKLNKISQVDFDALRNVIGDLLFRSLEYPGADEVAARIKKIQDGSHD